MADRRSFLDMRRKSLEQSMSQSRYSQIVTLNSEKLASRKISMASYQSSVSSSRSLNLNLVISPQNITQKLLPKFARITNPSTSYNTQTSHPFEMKTATPEANSGFGAGSSTFVGNSLQKYAMPRSKLESSLTASRDAEKPQSSGSSLKGSSIQDNRFSPNYSISESEEVIAKLGKLELSAYDIQCFRKGEALPRTVVDIYMKYLRMLNRQLTSAKEPHDRVFISSTNFSQRLFNRSATPPHAKVNLFKYDILLFPIFIGHWSLLVVNLRECVVTFLNPAARPINIEDFLICLFEFLKNELQYFENRELTMTRWKDLCFQKTQETCIYLPIDSVVYICKHAEFIATENRGRVDSGKMSEYRQELLNTILRESTVTNLDKYYELPQPTINPAYSSDNQITHKRRKLFEQSEINLRGHEKLFGPLTRHQFVSETPQNPTESLNYVKVRDRGIGTDDWDMNFRSYNFKRNAGKMHSPKEIETNQEKQVPFNSNTSVAFCNFDELRDRKERFYESLNRLQSSGKPARMLQEQLKVVPEEHLPYKRPLPEPNNSGSLLHAPKHLKEDAPKFTEEAKLSMPLQSYTVKSQISNPEQKPENAPSIFTNSLFSSSSIQNKPQNLFEGNEISNTGNSTRALRSLKINAVKVEQEFRENEVKSVFQTSSSIRSPEAKSQAYAEPKTPTFIHSQHSMFSPVIRNSKSKPDDSHSESKNLGNLFQSHHERSPSIFELPKSESSELIKPVPERVQTTSISESSNLLVQNPVPYRSASDQNLSLFSKKSNYGAKQDKSGK